MLPTVEMCMWLVLCVQKGHELPLHMGVLRQHLADSKERLLVKSEVAVGAPPKQI